jgi:hypothetical protein
MSGVRYQQEKLCDYPVPEDGFQTGKISASGINAYVKHNNTVIQGNYTYTTVTITLKGITTPPFSKPSVRGFGGNFTFRGNTYTIYDIIEGPKFLIAGTEKFVSWTVSGVDFSSGRISIG